MIYPDNFERKIGFDRIRTLVAGYALCSLGKERVEKMAFSTNFDAVEKWLIQTNEFRTICIEEDGFPIGYFLDLRTPLQKLRVEGLYLDEQELHDLRRSLGSVRDIVRFFKEKAEKYPQLAELSKGVMIYPFVFDRIDRVLTKNGKLKDNASPELAKIRSEISAKQGSISRKMASIMKNAIHEGWITQDTTLSIRDGRAVIPVPSGNKRKIKGIVHDESATGKTTFIEPEEIVEINNEIRELEYAERREIIKILSEVARDIAPYTDDLLFSYEYLGIIDFIRAKARFALEIQAVLPAYQNIPNIIWRRAVHPLLYLQHKSDNMEIVPLDIELNENHRIVLISGPNAGGKSVCLKSVGLMQYMFQNGMLVPMSENSDMGFFNDIFIDIGDEQSIENDLSTYSSHLTNMKFFARNCGAKSLFLIDEFGTGTEPMLGGAIAEAVLKHINEQKSFGVITTHYTNLKHFAAGTDGIVNGAMLFDTHKIQPLFKLQVGKPGSSFAFEIARKIGVPENILQYAHERIGQDHIDFDKHLREIVRDKSYWEQKRQSIRKNEKELEETLAKYGDELKNVKQERKLIIEKAKKEAKQLLEETNKRIENTIREIRESQAEKEKTRFIRKELETFKEQALSDDEIAEQHRIEEKIKKIKSREEKKTEHTPNKKVEPKVEEKPNLPIEKGCFVKLEGQETPGEVISISGKNAMVAFGLLQMSVKLERLERISNNEYKKAQRQTSMPTSSNVGERVRERKLTFKADLDVRGVRGEEAMQIVINHLDEALMCETYRVRILHGKGDGILRRLIREYLNTVPFVARFADEHIQMGGAGITVVDLDF